MGESQFGVMEDFEPALVAEVFPPNRYSTVCDAPANALQVWMTCVPHADGFVALGDVAPDAPLDREVGDEWMGWLHYVVQEGGLEEAVLFGRDTGDFGDDQARFLLENGIAPGQPFCVRFHGFRSYKSSWEYNEYDEEWEADVVAIEPWPCDRVLNAWVAWLMDDGFAEQLTLPPRFLRDR